MGRELLMEDKEVIEQFVKRQRDERLEKLEAIVERNQSGICSRADMIAFADLIEWFGVETCGRDVARRTERAFRVRLVRGDEIASRYGQNVWWKVSDRRSEIYPIIDRQRQDYSYYLRSDVAPFVKVCRCYICKRRMFFGGDTRAKRYYRGIVRMKFIVRESVRDEVFVCGDRCCSYIERENKLWAEKKQHEQVLMREHRAAIRNERRRLKALEKARRQLLRWSSRPAQEASALRQTASELETTLRN